MNATHAQIEAYRSTLEIARNTWDIASRKAVTTGNPEDLMEARAALHWVSVARTTLENAQAAVL